MKITLSVGFLCVLLVLAVASLPMSWSGSAEAAAPSFTTRAQAAPASLARGASTAITASVSSATAVRVSVDVEIYDNNGARVFERAYDDEAYTAGQTIQHKFTWQVPAKAVLGAYSIQVGVFSPDWSTQYVWNDT